MKPPELFIITGVSGSGKTTIARALSERGEVALDSKVTPGIYHFVDGDGNEAPEIRWHDPEWRQTYKWSLNRVILESQMRAHANADRVFLCGRANLFQYMNIAERVFLLQVSPETLLRRLNDERRDNLFAKDAETQTKLTSQLEAVQRKILDKGGVAIDAERPVDQVVNEILSKLKPDGKLG